MKIGLIALGCAKNRVDAEVMLANILKRGHEMCEDPAECDAIIVHTCTFIEAAKTESIEAILEAAQYKTDGKLKRLVVTGCMAERYREEIRNEMPEVDAVLGSKSFDRIGEALESEDIYTHYRPLSEQTPEGDRVLTAPPYSVYLKIADGCSNHCSYCVIPAVRGEFQPRTFDALMDETHKLVSAGAREINIIAQDTTKHPDLIRLIHAVCAIDEVRWVRILYCRPEGLSDPLLQAMASEPKCVPYIDLPLQHASGKILKKMNRTGDPEKLTALLAHVRDMLPGCILRTTFIVGFPHEDEEDFTQLCEFIKTNRFHNLGVFPYSREEGTKAAAMHGQIEEDTKHRRAEIVMGLQNRLLPEINAPFLDTVQDVLCEGETENGYVGRGWFQAPEVDGKVYFTSGERCRPGDFVRVLLKRYDEYDFYGTAVSE